MKIEVNLPLLIKTEVSGRVSYCGGWKNLQQPTCFGQARKIKWVSDIKKAKAGGGYKPQSKDKKVPHGTKFSYIQVKQTTEVIDATNCGIKVTIERI